MCCNASSEAKRSIRPATISVSIHCSRPRRRSTTGSIASSHSVSAIVAPTDRCTACLKCCEREAHPRPSRRSLCAGSYPCIVQSAQPNDIAQRRRTEQPAVFAAELRRAFIADLRRDQADVGGVLEQQ